MYFLILCLPLMSLLFSSLFSRKIGEKGIGIINTSALLITFLFSVYIFLQYLKVGHPIYIHLISWIDCQFFIIPWSLMFDSLSIIMLIVVTSVSTLVHLYSIEYMNGDPHVSRFLNYLTLFTFFMLILVTSNNLVQLFVGWEGVGLSSYLLISFWFTRIEANKAAIKAILVNRFGDFGLSLALFFSFLFSNTLEFDSFFALTPLIKKEVYIFGHFFNGLSMICFLIMVGAIGKSAQIGLHTWLPDAMEGPTPVSALIHAATMVTAGIFLIIRTSTLFELVPSILWLITLIGSITVFFAASTGMLQNDLKKVIAYSTCSQLGYMFFICGFSNYSLSLFHLANHAFFKALLFLTAGSIIHGMADEQDMRKLGGLLNIFPYSYSVILIGSLSLMGIPFLTGFYSKDVILELTYATYSINGMFTYWLGTLGAFLTAFYSFRLIYLTFIIKTNAFKKIISYSGESNLFVTMPLFLLSLGSIFVGYLFKDMFIGLGSSFWNNSIFILPENNVILDSEFLPYYLKLIPVIFSLLGGVISFLGYNYFLKLLYLVKMNWITSYLFFNKKWYFDNIYNEYFVYPSLNFGYRISFKLIDRGFIEWIGPTGLSILFKRLINTLVRVQSGYIYLYALFILGSTLLFTVIYFIGMFR